MLWGLLRARENYWINTAPMVTNFGLCFYLLMRVGVEGVGWGFLVSMTVRSILFFLLFSERVSQTGVFSLIRGSPKGIFLSAAVSRAVTWKVFSLAGFAGLFGMIAAALARRMASSTGLHFGRARPEEGMLAREVRLSLITLVPSAWPGLRRTQHRIELKYRSYFFWRESIGH